MNSARIDVRRPVDIEPRAAAALVFASALVDRRGIDDDVETDFHHAMRIDLHHRRRYPWINR